MAGTPASGAVATPGREGTGRALRALVPGKAAAWALWAVAVVASWLGVVYGYAEVRLPLHLIPQSIVSYLVGAIVATVFGTVGLALRLRRPDIVVGWLF